MVLDCCYAGAAATPSQFWCSSPEERAVHKLGNVDMLAVCGPNSDHANEPGYYSWTSRICEALEEMRSGSSFSTQELFGWIKEKPLRDEALGWAWPSGEILDPELYHLAVNPDRGEIHLTPIKEKDTRTSQYEGVSGMEHARPEIEHWRLLDLIHWYLLLCMYSTRKKQQSVLF